MTAQVNYYRVEKQFPSASAGECNCANCTLWTVVYGPTGDETEIGQAWQGDEGKEAAEDVCDLMNMAFDAGQESRDAK